MQLLMGKNNTSRKNRDRADLPRPQPHELQDWISRHLGFDIPAVSVCPHHQAPLDYITAAYNDQSDLVVWAPRGGGKTTLGAVATLLDLLFKPSCQVRILGGSLDQSLRMWEELQPMLERHAHGKLLGRAKNGIASLRNGSAVKVLAQSQRSVRGQRVQKLRCDEVELFDPKVWEAAQLVTRSRSRKELQRLGASDDANAIPATLEALSTMHKPYGLMQQIVDSAEQAGRRVIRWCILDVLEKCVDRDCPGCPLHEECAGRARNAAGFFSIDDAIQQKKRVSKDTWESEMLCLRPSRHDTVFHSFKPDKHVSERDFWDGATAGVQRTLAIDFGYRNPFVCLWVLSDIAGRVYVVDEYVKSLTVLSHHARLVRNRHPGFLDVSCDPSGKTTNSHTALADVDVLRHEGLRVRHRSTHILDGLEDIRTALDPAWGEPTLRIHPRCKRLIRSMECYHYKPGSKDEGPDKDNENDHCIDALRYFYVNRSKGITGATRY